MTFDDILHILQTGLQPATCDVRASDGVRITRGAKMDDAHRCTYSYFPPARVAVIAAYMDAAQMLPSDPVTLVFPEAGAACAELALALHLLRADRLRYSRIVLMDAMYDDVPPGRKGVCQRHTDSLTERGIPVVLTRSYADLTATMRRLEGKFVVVGMHQRTSVPGPQAH